MAYSTPANALCSVLRVGIRNILLEHDPKPLLLLLGLGPRLRRKHPMKASEIQTVRDVRVRRHRKLYPEQLAHVMSNLRDVLISLVSELRSEAQKATDGDAESVDARDDVLELLPRRGVELGDVRRSHKHGRQEAEMPVALLVNGAVPVVMVAERTRAAVGSAGTVEARITVVALDSVGHLARRRRAHLAVANARNELVSRRLVILRIRAVANVPEDSLGVNGLVLGAVPWEALDPLRMRDELPVELLEIRKAEMGEVSMRVGNPFAKDGERRAFTLVLEALHEDGLALILEILGKLRRAPELLDDGNDEALLSILGDVERVLRSREDGAGLGSQHELRLALETACSVSYTRQTGEQIRVDRNGRLDVSELVELE